MKAKEMAKTFLKIVGEHDTARRLEVHLTTMNKVLHTPDFIMTTKG